MHRRQKSLPTTQQIYPMQQSEGEETGNQFECVSTYCSCRSACEEKFGVFQDLGK